VAPKGLSHYLKTHYGDRTFEHLYRWNAFDTALLIPYFIVMVILAFYGIHRYQLVWLYYKNKKNTPKWDEPPARFAEGELPFVTIQLPIFNEQFVIDRLIEAVCRLNYPRDRFEIQVLDDSTDETVHVARQIVERYAAGFGGVHPIEPSLSSICIEPIVMGIRRVRLTRVWTLRVVNWWRSSMRTSCRSRSG
jgi:cellulose synthase/poly-beta-1,6-N-acetylglucosamine synthase-like glycosyltransferase